LSFLLLFILSIPFSQAQENQSEKHKAAISATLRARGEAYIALPITSHKSAAELLKNFSPGKVHKDTAFFFITAEDTALLYSSGIRFSVEPAPSLTAAVTMASSIPEVLQGLAYPTYSQYLSIMESFRDNYPDMVSVDTIGHSINNRLILAARIQTQEYPPEVKPVVFLSSTIHGDEPPGYVVLLMLLNDLTLQYSSSSDIKNLLDNLILIINPLANPDGTYFYSDTTVYGSKRTNLNNVDLNRNFPDPYDGWLPGGARQPENLAMMSYMEKIRPSLSANLHSGAEVVNYPWDWGTRLGSGIANPHPDNNWFRLVSTEYADAARNGYPDYMNLFPGGITNGAYWYVIYGGRQDYVTAFIGGRELTLEISNDFIPPASQLHWFYERNRDALVSYVRQATYGLHGKVSDEVTGVPLGKVEIRLEDHDSDFSVIYSDSITGAFHRFLKGGDYSISFMKEGYETFTADINISDYERIDMEILLTTPDFVAYPNPFHNEMHVKFYASSSGSARADIYSLTGQHMYSADYTLDEGLNIILIETAVPDGMYILKVTTNEGVWKRRIMRIEY